MRHPRALAAVVVVSALALVGSAEAAPFVYAPVVRFPTTGTSPSVAVIDAATGAVTATVALPDLPVDVVATPDGAKVYVATAAGVHVIGTASNTVIATIPVPAAGMALSGDGSRLHVARSASSADPGLVVVDTASDTVVGSVGLPQTPALLVANADGSRVYVAVSTASSPTGAEGGRLLVITPATGMTTATVDLTGTPTGLAVSPDGARVYVSQSTSSGFTPAGSVAIVSAATNAVTGSISAFGPLVVSPDGGRLYVAQRDPSLTVGGPPHTSLRVFDTAGRTSLATIALVGAPGNVVLSSDGTRLFAAATTSGTVSPPYLTSTVVVVDMGANAIAATVPLDGSASLVAVTPGAHAPSLAVSPTATDFCTTVVGGTTERTLTIRNAGGGVLTGTVEAPSPFTIVSGGTLNVAGGGSQRVVLRFMPPAAVTSAGLVTITSSAGTAPVAVTGTGVSVLPTVELTLSGRSFRSGQTLTVGLDARLAAGAPASDLYVGALLPDNETAVFLSGAGAIAGGSRLATPSRFVPTTPASATSAAFLTYTFPASIPAGAYRLFAAYARPGSLADDRLDACDIVALGLESLTFTP